MANPLFYENPVPLDKDAHRNLRVRHSGGDFAFTEKTNSVILATVEFAPAALDYPIAFTRLADGKIVPVALLGVRNYENLFVTNGKWRQNSYIPAFVRRYPFIPAETGSEQLTVCIDDKYAGFTPDNGEPLFDEQGEPAALLKQAIALMQDYHAQCKRTEEFTCLLRELDLFKEASIHIEMKDGAPITLSGMLMVDEGKLANLARDDVWNLHANGHLPLIYVHLLSERNFGRLVDLLAERLSMQPVGKTVRSTKSAPTSAIPDRNTELAAPVAWPVSPGARTEGTPKVTRKP
jgi:hypothetical protein